MKPGRTLGLSLAILGAVMLFSVLPLLQVAMILLLRYRLQNASLPLEGDTTPSTPFAVGGAFVGVDDGTMLLQAGLGIGFLIIAFFAWRGRPGWIRFVMIGAVALLTLISIGVSVAPLISAPDLNAGIDSGEAIRNVLLSGRMIVSVLLALYVAWYMNRGPARAFYRGYYRHEADGTAVNSS